MTAGDLRTVREPERRSAVDHPAEGALAVGLELAGHDLHLASQCLRLVPHRPEKGLGALPPFVPVGTNEQRPLPARDETFEEGVIAARYRLAEAMRELPELAVLLRRGPLPW